MLIYKHTNTLKTWNGAKQPPFLYTTLTMWITIFTTLTLPLDRLHSFKTVLYMLWPNSIQQNAGHLLFTFEKVEIFAISNGAFNNSWKFLSILEIQFLQSLYFLLFSLYYFAHYFVHYLRINLADKMYLFLYWVTYNCVYIMYVPFLVDYRSSFWRSLSLSQLRCNALWIFQTFQIKVTFRQIVIVTLHNSQFCNLGKSMFDTFNNVRSVLGILKPGSIQSFWFLRYPGAPNIVLCIRDASVSMLVMLHSVYCSVVSLD